MIIGKIKYSIWHYYNFGREFQTSGFLEDPIYPSSVLSLQLDREHFRVSKLVFQPYSAPVIPIIDEL